MAPMAAFLGAFVPPLLRPLSTLIRMFSFEERHPVLVLLLCILPSGRAHLANAPTKHVSARTISIHTLVNYFYLRVRFHCQRDAL